jgi:hypothetical protein
MTVTRVLTVLLLLAPPARAAEAPRGDALLRAEMLAAHNGLRREFGQPPLAWDATLEAAAAAHAAALGERNRLAHGRDLAEQGENLWMGSRNAFTYAEMATAWAEERIEFVPGRFPNVSRSLGWEEVGHFTQMVWHSTTRLGCALASNAENDILVCRYAPAGNVDGESPLGR